MKFEGRIVDAPRGGATPLAGQVSVRVGANGTAFFSIPETEARELFGASGDDPGKAVVIDGEGKDEGKIALVAVDRPGAREVRRPPKRKSYEVAVPARSVRLRDALSVRLPFEVADVGGYKAIVITLDPSHRSEANDELQADQKRQTRKRKAESDGEAAEAA